MPIITGFIGKDDKGRITTVGRGGSDLTATMFGAAAKADEIQVWKVNFDFVLFCFAICGSLRFSTHLFTSF